MACRPPSNRAVVCVWRAAIAINNIGWALFERGCHDQAHQTLKEAAHVMVALMNDDDAAAGGEETRQAVEAILRDANLRLAFPRPSSPPPPSWSGREEGLLLRPEPLRLDVDEWVADAPFDFVAIAVHNSAVSYYYQSLSAANDPDAQRRLRSTAVSLLRTSYSIISKACGCAPATLAHALHILENLDKVGRSSAVVTGAAAAALGGRPEPGETQTARASETFELDAELTHLRALVQALERVYLTLFGPAAYAAAA